MICDKNLRKYLGRDKDTKNLFNYATLYSNNLF